MGRRQKVSKSEDLPKHQNIKAFGLKARHITTFRQRYYQFFSIRVLRFTHNVCLTFKICIMLFFTNFKKRIILLTAMALPFALSAQTPGNRQIITANGGLFEINLPYNDFVTVQTVDPITNQALVFDTIKTQSVQDVVVSGNFAYVAAQDSIVKYDITTYTRQAVALVEGVNKLAVYNNLLIITRQYPVTEKFVQVRSTTDLSLLKEFSEITGESAGILVKGTKAYIAVNGGWAGTSGKIAILDMVTVRFEEEIDLGADAIGIYNLFRFKENVVSVNRTPYGGTTGSLSVLDPTNHFTTTVYNANIGSGYQVYNKILYVGINGNIGSFDLNSMTVLNPTLIENPAVASFGSIASATLDTINMKFYVNATDFFSWGQGYVYNFTGDSIGAFSSGISCEAMAIDYTSVTGIPARNGSNDLAIFPNPCSARLSITSVPSNSLISIYSIDGQLVFQETVSTASELLSLDVDQLKNGVYMLVVTHNQQIYRSKFVKN